MSMNEFYCGTDIKRLMPSLIQIQSFCKEKSYDIIDTEVGFCDTVNNCLSKLRIYKQSCVLTNILLIALQRKPAELPFS